MNNKASLSLPVLFIIQGVITFIISCIILVGSGRSGGEVGMTPILFFMIQVVQLIFTLIMYFLTKSIIKQKFHHIYFFVNVISLIVIFKLDKGTTSIFENTTNGFVSRTIIFSQILSNILLFLYYKYFIVNGK